MLNVVPLITVILNVIVLRIAMLSIPLRHYVVVSGGLLSVVMLSCHCSEHSYTERRGAECRYKCPCAE